MNSTATENPGGLARPQNRVLSALLLLLCCGHAIYLLASIAPKFFLGGARSVQEGGALHPLQLLLGGGQEWNMFLTAPKLHSMNVRVETEDARGRLTAHGCLLPSLAPYPQPESARLHVLYYRMLSNATSGTHFQHYLRRLGETPQLRNVASQGGRWWLAVDAEWTTLTLAPEGGVSYVPASRIFDPANPGGVQR